MASNVRLTCASREYQSWLNRLRTLGECRDRQAGRQAGTSALDMRETLPAGESVALAKQSLACLETSLRLRRRVSSE